MKFWKTLFLFFFGGTGYVGLELLWRRRSHSSMFFLGGLCFLCLGQLDRRYPRTPLPLRLCAGSGIITALELATGELVNRDHRIWDYSGLPFHFRGQICLLFSLIWAPLSVLAGRMYGLLWKKLDPEHSGSSR